LKYGGLRPKRRRTASTAARVQRRLSAASGFQMRPSIVDHNNTSLPHQFLQRAQQTKEGIDRAPAKAQHNDAATDELCLTPSPRAQTPQASGAPSSPESSLAKQSPGHEQSNRRDSDHVVVVKGNEWI